MTINKMNQQFNAYLMELAQKNSIKANNVRKRVMGFNNTSNQEYVPVVASSERITIKGFKS